MLSVLDTRLFPDSITILKIPESQDYIYPIHKNGSSSLMDSGFSIVDPSDYKSIETIQVFVREPYQRFLSGVNTYLKHNFNKNRDSLLDFTYVDDVARGTVASLKQLGFETINLGSGIPIVLSDAIKTIESIIGKKAEIIHKPAHPADVKKTWADNSKAQKTLDWSPQVSFEDGIKSLVKWYEQNQSWARNLKSVS